MSILMYLDTEFKELPLFSLFCCRVCLFFGRKIHRFLLTFIICNHGPRNCFYFFLTLICFIVSRPEYRNGVICHRKNIVSLPLFILPVISLFLKVLLITSEYINKSILDYLLLLFFG